MKKRLTGKNARRLLDGALALALGAAAVVATRERVLPLWREVRAVDPGERLPGTVRLVSAGGRPLRPGARGPAVLFLYLSTCPACDRAAPAYREMTAALPGRVWAVALSAGPDETAWARARVPGARRARLLRPTASLELLRIDRVPATLVVDSEGRLRFRRVGSLRPGDVERIRDLAGPSPRSEAAAPARRRPG
jgi:hypothetical protein